MKFYKCRKCGHVVYSINEKCENVKCCDEEMMLLKAGETDGALEKHVPVYVINDSIIEVTVGEVIHPMEEDHYIEFICYEANNNVYFKKLLPGSEPKASFPYMGKGVIYEYCNKHGLWKKDVE